MRPFRRGAFEIAARAGVPVWPVLVTCRPSALSKGLPIWKHPERVARLRVEPCEVLADLTDGRSACRATEELFRQRLGVGGPAAVPRDRTAPLSAPVASP
jgi:hypothetical protein